MPRASSRWPKAATMPRVHWVDPRRRGILPLDGFHISRSLRAADPRAGLCTYAPTATSRPSSQAAPTARKPGSTRRSSRFIEPCTGQASPIRWRSGKTRRLVGGVYGVTLGAAFFGESMFSRRTDASKVALAWLVDRLRAGGFTPVRHPVPDAAPGSRSARWKSARRLSPASGAGDPGAAASFTPPGYAPTPYSGVAAQDPDVIARMVQRRQRRADGDHPARKHRLRHQAVA